LKKATDIIININTDIYEELSFLLITILKSAD